MSFIKFIYFYQVKNFHFFLKNLPNSQILRVNKIVKIKLYNKSEKNIKIKASLINTKNKRLSQRCVVYKVKINESSLTKHQKEQLKMLFVEGKWFYNYELRLLKDGIFKDVDPLDIKDVIHLDKNRNKLKSSLQFLTSSYKQSINKQIVSSLKTIKTLRKNSFIKHGDLHFINECKSLNLKQYGNTYAFKSMHKMKIQGISKHIKICGAKQFWNKDEIEFANAKLLNTANGYYVAVTCYLPKDNKKISKKNQDIALDFGCQTTLTSSNGEKIDCVVEETGQLKRLQAKLAKQQKRSNNYNKTLKKIRAKYEHMTNKKNDISNKIVHKLNAYDHIVIQDEQLSSWHKNGHGKAVQHSILGRLKAKLKLLPQTVILDKFIPTTQLCINCGKKNPLTQRQRIYECSCGVKEDRDIHAAKNMLWIYQNLVGRDAAEFTLEEFKASMLRHLSMSKAQALDIDTRRCSVFS